MTNSLKRKRGLAFAAILLMPFLCSFTEEGSQSDEYLTRRYYEKILVERFTNNEVSIQSDSSTIYTAKGSLTSYYNGNDLTRVSANLDGFSAPIDVNYQYDQEDSLQRYSNGHITLEKITNGPETLYLVDGDKALSILEKDESVCYTYPDGEMVWEEVSPNGQFRVMRNSDYMFEGTDGPDGMLTCNAHHGLREEWVYDQDGNLGLYNSSGKTFYEKKPKNSSSTDVAIGSYGMCDTYSVQENDCMMTYSNKNGSLISDYDINSSRKFFSLKSNGNRWDMQFSLRGDKPLDQIGEVSSPYGTYEASFDDNNIVSSVSKNGITQKIYEYDGMNRLMSSKDRTGGSSYYVYDDANNILKAFCSNEDVKGDWNYKYSKGCLESVNGEPILHDKKGNIESFGKNHYQWEMGSLLTKAYQGDSATCFRYDAMKNPVFKDSERDGETRLVWEGRRLVAQANAKNMMSFLYDCFGSVIGFNYSEHFYAYCKNTFQDVVAIVRDDGTVVAEYSYGDFGEPGKVNDADGSGLAFMNPFRYRSYYFDQDLGLYHLRTRWYSPELRRFLSSDSPKTMLDEAYKKELLLNRYSYCANNPIAYIDSQGTVLDVAATGVAIVLFGFLIFCVLIVAVVGSYIQAGNATSGFDGTTTSPYTPGTPTYQPVPSVAEPPVMEEPIVEGGGTIAEQPGTETQFDPLSDADVQKGLKMLAGALGMALASAKLRIGRLYRHQTETHHIVPQNAIDFFQLLPRVRSYMNRLKVCHPWGVDAGINLVDISTLLHKGLHNALYIQGVALIFDPITYFDPEVGEPFFIMLLALVKADILAIDRTLWTLL